MEKYFINRQISARILVLLTDNEVTGYALMKDLGIPKATFYNCMNSEREWSIENIVKIAEYFKVSVDYLLKGPITDQNGTHLLNKQRMEDLVYTIEKLDQEKQTLEEENERLRTFITRSAELLDQVKKEKKVRGKKM